MKKYLISILSFIIIFSLIVSWMDYKTDAYLKKLYTEYPVLLFNKEYKGIVNYIHEVRYMNLRSDPDDVFLQLNDFKLSIETTKRKWTDNHLGTFIQIGDSLCKDKNSKELFVFDKYGKKKEKFIVHFEK